MNLAYLVNQYPKVSHAFIRREIEALETSDSTIRVLRFSVRRTREPLPDPADRIELAKTAAILDQVWLGLPLATVIAVLTSPLRFVRALAVAMLLGWKGDRGLLRHLVFLMEAAWLGRRLSKERVSHLHSHFGTNSTTVALLTHVLTDIPYSFTVHGPEEFDKATILGLETKIRHASFVVAISSFGKSQLMRWCSAEDWPKLHVVRCGVDANFLVDAPSPVATNRTLVCVGRLCEQKGQLLLIEAASRLVQQGCELELRLVGDGPMRKECEGAIKRWNLQRHVTITGWASGEMVKHEIEQAGVFVLPSFAEGLPVVIMEALALGRPVISTYVAGIPELVQNGINGWLVPAGDVEALVEAMRMAIETPAVELQAMGARGRERVGERHDVRIESKRLAGLLTLRADEPAGPAIGGRRAAAGQSTPATSRGESLKST